MMQNKVEGLLGLTRRAGKLSLGHDAAEDAIVSGKAKLCILAKDASERLKAEMARTIAFKQNETKLIETAYTKAELSMCIGAKSVAVFTIDDEGFAKAILKLTGKDGLDDEKI